MEWFYADEANQQISFQEEEFQSLVEKGSIKTDTLVWNSTMSEWKKASLAQPALFGMHAHAPANPATAAPYAGASAPPAPTDGLAIASMICGIFSLLLFCIYGLGIFPGIAAIICGHMAKRKMNDGGPTGGSGMTTAGLIMGYIGTVLNLIAILLVIAAIGFAFMSAIPVRFDL